MSSTIEKATQFWGEAFLAQGGSLPMPQILHEYAESLGRGKPPELKPLEWYGDLPAKCALTGKHYKIIDGPDGTPVALFQQSITWHEIGKGTTKECMDACEAHRNERLRGQLL